jgi:hypothetical protein
MAFDRLMVFLSYYATSGVKSGAGRFFMSMDTPLEDVLDEVRQRRDEQRLPRDWGYPPRETFIVVEVLNHPSGYVLDHLVLPKDKGDGGE